MNKKLRKVKQLAPSTTEMWLQKKGTPETLKQAVNWAIFSILALVTS